MKSWSYTEAGLLNPDEYIALIEHLKRHAGIPLDQPIWDAQKIAKFVSLLKKRKAKYFIAVGVGSLFSFAATIFLIVSLACIADGNQCPEIIKSLSALYFGITGIVASASFIYAKNKIRPRQETKLEDCLLSSLSNDQRVALIDVINRLKNNHEALYMVEINEELRKIDSHHWRTDNWILLLTENHKDRFAIMLDGEWPKGMLVLKRPKKQPSLKPEPKKEISLGEKIEEKKFWDRIKGPNSRKLFPSKLALSSFINQIDTFELNHFHAAWLSALIIIKNNHEELCNYIEGNLSLTQQKEFERKLTPTFATISDDYKKAINAMPSEEQSRLDTYEYGLMGAQKFLLGKNFNIDQWIGKKIANDS